MLDFGSLLDLGITPTKCPFEHSISMLFLGIRNYSCSAFIMKDSFLLPSFLFCSQGNSGDALQRKACLALHRVHAHKHKILVVCCYHVPILFQFILAPQQAFENETMNRLYVSIYVLTISKLSHHLNTQRLTLTYKKHSWE